MRWTFRQKALDNTTTLKRIQTESFIFFETCRVSNHLKVHSLTRSYIFFFFLHIYISSTLTTNKKTKNLVSSKRRFFSSRFALFPIFFQQIRAFSKKKLLSASNRSSSRRKVPRPRPLWRPRSSWCSPMSRRSFPECSAMTRSWRL